MYSYVQLWECVCNQLCNRSLQLLHTYIHKSLVNMLQHVSTVWHRFLTHHCNVSERAEFCTICCLYLRFHGTVPWCKLLAMRSAALVSISCNHDETGKIKPGVILTGFSLCADFILGRTQRPRKRCMTLRLPSATRLSRRWTRPRGVENDQRVEENNHNIQSSRKAERTGGTCLNA